MKTCTQNSMLYVLLQNLIESENQIPLWDKYYGTIKQLVNIGINTEQKSNKVASTQTENLIVSDNNLTNNKHDHLIAKHVATVNGIKSNLILNSSVVKSKGSESEMIFENLTSILSSSNSPSHSHLPKEINVDFTENTNPQQCLQPKNCGKNDILSINALLRDLQDSPEFEQQSPRLGNTLIDAGLENENVMHMSELPESIFIHRNTLRPNKINKIHGNKLKCERIAKEYELLRSMKDIPQELRTRLNNKFIYLFGRGHNYDADPLSEEEQRTVAHKRIVKLVVQFMTPYYNEQRISRRMFKSLAKIISKTFMDRSYDPGNSILFFFYLKSPFKLFM